ncbi:MAG: HEAT repeat domain-containing protein [Armatimonadota bacterium]
MDPNLNNISGSVYGSNSRVFIDARREAAKDTAKRIMVLERAKKIIKSIEKLGENVFLSTMGEVTEETMLNYAWELAGFGEVIIPELTQALKHRSVILRRTVMEALISMGPDAKKAVPALICVLDNDRDLIMRGKVIVALARMGEGAEEAVPSLMNMVKHKEKGLYGPAILALGYIGSNAKKAVTVLKKASSDKDARIRILAAWAMGRIDPSLRSYALGIIRREFLFGDEQVKATAAMYLIKLNPASKKLTASILMDILKTSKSNPYAFCSEEEMKSYKLRYLEIAEVLSNTDANLKDKAVHYIILFTKAEHCAAVRREAVEVIGRLKSKDVYSILTLINIKNNDKNKWIRALAGKTLKKMPPFETETDVVNLLNLASCAEDRYMREAAFYALGKMGVRALHILIAALRVKDTAMRLTSARLIGKLGKKGLPAVNPLIKLLDDEMMSVRIASVESLGNIGPGAMMAVPHLVKIIENKDEYIDLRVAAVESLGKIGRFNKDSIKALNSIKNDDYEEDDLKKAARKVLKKLVIIKAR